MDEESAVIAWAWSLLSADSVVAGLVGNRVFDTAARPGTVGDYITLHSLGPIPNGTSANGTLSTFRMTLTVKAITQAQNDFSRGAAIKKAASAVLQKQTGSSNGVNILECIRGIDIPRYAEGKDGVTYQHQGSRFRIIGTYQ